jgi:TonB family protein
LTKSLRGNRLTSRDPEGEGEDMPNQLIRRTGPAALLLGIFLVISSGTAPALRAQDPQSKEPQTGATGQTESGSSAAQAEKVLPDSGSVSENVYTSDFFGFTFEFPKGWSVQGEVTKRYIMDVGNAALSGGDPSQKAVLELAEKKTHQLLTVFEHPVGTPVPFNPGIIVLAEDISFAPGIQKGSDYLLNVKMALAARPNISVVREPADVSFAGLPFSRMDVSMETRTGVIVYEAYVATIHNGYALAFLIIGDSQKRLDELAEALNTIQFKGQPSTSESKPASETPAQVQNSNVQSSRVQSRPVTTLGAMIITPLQGVASGGYLKEVIATIKKNWNALMPDSSQKGEKGEVVVRFSIQRDGSTAAAPTIEKSSGNDALDQAAVNAIRSAAPFESFPADFHGPLIELRFVFYYNVPELEAFPAKKPQ